MSDARLSKVELEDPAGVRRGSEIEHERAVAAYDLMLENHFAPAGQDGKGPFHLKLGIQENRLVFDIRDAHDQKLMSHMLSLGPFRRIVRDYFTICESYYTAVKTATVPQIEAIDMGRRGVHNEGAELLRQRLEGKIDIDEATARRLFTLVCVLHIRG